MAWICGLHCKLIDGVTLCLCCHVAGGVEWDVMIADAVEPPFVPNQDINAASQSAIGSFNDENQYRKVGNIDALAVTEGRMDHLNE